jgi:transglutaminase superfamily protein/uncharacterized protein DUF3858/uncharacterized protein DUF3857
MLFSRVTTIACFIIISVCTFSQTKELKVKFGDVKPEDFKPQVYSIDSSAEAVYLYDIGSAHDEGNTSGWFSVVFKVSERIRLLKKNSFDHLATIKIPLYVKEAEKEKLEDLQAATYNLEDGKVVQTKVDKSSIFKEKDGDYEIVKFTFPDLKEGSIIEYTYTTISPYFQHIPTWSFQGNYPELWSQFSIEQPQFFDFAILKQGYLQPVIDTTISSADNFNILETNGTQESQNISVRSTTVKRTWAFKDIPALKEESYITNMDNYIQRLEFQLSAVRLPNEVPKTFMTTWYETADQLMKDEDFGQDLSKENGWIKDDVKQAVNGESDAVQKAKNIYEYVKNNYSCTDYSAVYLSQSLKKTEQLKKGNVSDINMLLVAMLRNAGFNADPVLLSTRDHGKTYNMYPILSKFNYVIARVNSGDNFYLLDATQSNLGFGHLKENCFNGDARIIASNPFIVDLSADSLKETEVTSLFLSNDSSGNVSGTYKCIMGEMQSEEMREKMKKSKEDEYFGDIKKGFSFDANLSNTFIDSLKRPEMPVAVEYNVDFKLGDDLVYFDPLMFADIPKENPFKSAQRNYPVEMPYCTDKTYVMNMEVPQGYKVDELPKSARVSLNDNEGSFEYLIQQSGNNIQLRCRTKLNKANFEPEDYETLRNFFAFIVEKEGEQIVFKKQ